MNSFIKRNLKLVSFKEKLTLNLNKNITNFTTNSYKTFMTQNVKYSLIDYNTNFKNINNKLNTFCNNDPEKNKEKPIDEYLNRLNTLTFGFSGSDLGK